MSDDGPVTLSREDWHTIWNTVDLMNEAAMKLSDIKDACETLGFPRAVAKLHNVQNEIGTYRDDITKILLMSDDRMNSPSDEANEQMEARS